MEQEREERQLKETKERTLSNLRKQLQEQQSKEESLIRSSSTSEVTKLKERLGSELAVEKKNIESSHEEEIQRIKDQAEEELKEKKNALEKEHQKQREVLQLIEKEKQKVLLRLCCILLCCYSEKNQILYHAFRPWKKLVSNWRRLTTWKTSKLRHFRLTNKLWKKLKQRYKYNTHQNVSSLW